MVSDTSGDGRGNPEERYYFSKRGNNLLPNESIGTSGGEIK